MEVIQRAELPMADYGFRGNQVHIPLDHFKGGVPKDLLETINVRSHGNIRVSQPLLHHFQVQTF